MGRVGGPRDYCVSLKYKSIFLFFFWDFVGLVGQGDLDWGLTKMFLNIVFFVLSRCVMWTFS